MKTTYDIEQLKQIFENSKEEILNDYFTFLRFKSISSEPGFQKDIHTCCNWLTNYLSSLDFHVEQWQTPGHPTLFASYDKAGPSQPTLLIYNHYDVQPVDPLDLWESPPFAPTIRNGQVYARGAQDNKGQCFYVLLALKTLLQRDGRLPINIKLCIEGEEECGSSGLSAILQDRKKELKADYLAIVDLGMHGPNSPAVTLGIRGIVTMDIEVTGTRSDLHSGSHGGVAFNPIHALIKVLEKVRDAKGKITIPGFYDDVLSLDPLDKAQIDWNFNHAEYESDFGAKPTGGETEFPPMERNWTRPTFEINGIAGGYVGSGFKTVIPAKAHAKVSCRLVPNQNPETIGRLVKQFLESNAPEGVKVTVKIRPGDGKAARASVSSKVVQAFAKSYEEVFKVKCHYTFAGGSIPIATELADACGGEIVMVGLGLPDDNIHAPNEHFGIDRIEKGFLSTARAIELLENKP